MAENQDSTQPSQAPKLPGEMSRRDLLKNTLIVGGGAVAAGLAAKYGVDRLFPPKPRKFEGPITPENDFMSLGKPESVKLDDYGIWWTPDTRASYVTFDDGERVYFVSGNSSTFDLLKKDGKFVPRNVDPNGQAVACYGPDSSKPYRDRYGAINSVLQLDNQNKDHLIGITHNEEWGNQALGTQTFSIGYVESFDRGKTWEDHGTLISAPDALGPGQKVTGVGEPSAVLREVDGKQFVYIYYLYLPSKDGVPYYINLSRSPILDGKLGKVEHYTKKGFRSDVEVSPDTIQPVLLPPTGVDSYTALPSVSFNKERDEFEAVFEMSDGFYANRSKDGISWREPQQILKFPHQQYPHFDGQVWYSNPTLWSEDQPSDQNVSERGYLIYSKGTWPQPHSMEQIPFQMK